MKTGIRAHDMKKTSPEGLSEALDNSKIKYIQLVIQKAFENISDTNLSKDRVESILKPLSDKSINIALIGAYFNPVHSNTEKVKANISRFKDHLKHASYFKTQYVGTETGSFNDDKWTYNPKNHTEEAYLQVKSVIQDLVSYAETVNATVLIEGAYNHVIYKPELLKRLVSEINSKHLKVIIDLYNYLNIDNYHQYQTIFESCLKLLKEDIVVFHMKDFLVQEGKLIQTGLGQGLIDFDFIIKKIKDTVPNAYLILEGITGEDITSSIKLINELEKKYE